MIGQGGDGGTVDIGFGCLSGMFERGDDVLYICYDNEGYMNTGVQRSAATPPAARTSTTQAVGEHPGAPWGQGKFVPLIALAHEIPYVATATIADLRDLETKVEHAMTLRGPRYIHMLVTCPLGWGTASSESIAIARLASETGFFPVFEGAYGEVTAVTKIRRRRPIEDYLRPQRRYAHLFKPVRRDDVIARLQARADRQHRAVRPARRGRGQRRALRPRRRCHGRGGARMTEHPFAITLDVGSSRANHTGSWRTERPTYVHRVAPCGAACPAGEDPQAWLYHAEEAGYEQAWRTIMEVNPFPAVIGRVCYHPCETECNRAQLDEAVGINSVERFLGDEALAPGVGDRRPAQSRPASACWSSAPARPACPPPTTSRASGTR